MISSFFRFGLAFILLILVQVLVFNNIQFSGYVNPYVYIMFILLLPVEIPSWLLLLLSFLTGIIMDFFMGSPGMHASATLFAGFIRPYVLRIISPRDGYEAGSAPSMFTYGFRWFVIYTTIIVFIHHLILFYLEVFRFADFFITMERVFLSLVISITFILLFEYYRKKR
jgi:rod shape-determining protein MreD